MKAAPLPKAAAEIMAELTVGMAGDETYRKIDKTGGTFMPVVVERVGPHRFSVAHYYEQNGDLVADPDLELELLDGGWYPAAISQPFSGYRRVLELGEDGKIAKCSADQFRDLSSFAVTFLQNIKSQQGDLRP